jgi:hypothetical protein
VDTSISFIAYQVKKKAVWLRRFGGGEFRSEQARA